MANLFFNGEKASKEEAHKALMEHIADIWQGAFAVTFPSDGGGVHIQAILEFEDTNVRMPDELRSKFPAKWMGWRMVVLKVPRGHIDVFYSDKQ